MEARIKPQTNTLNNKTVFAVITKDGVVARKDTKEEAKEWATKNGYTLRYSG